MHTHHLCTRSSAWNQYMVVSLLLEPVKNPTWNFRTNWLSPHLFVCASLCVSEREREREVIPCVRGRGREGDRERSNRIPSRSKEDTDTANIPKRHRMRELTLHSQSNKRSCWVCKDTLERNTKAFLPAKGLGKFAPSFKKRLPTNKSVSKKELHKQSNSVSGVTTLSCTITSHTGKALSVCLCLSCC